MHATCISNTIRSTEVLGIRHSQARRNYPGQNDSVVQRWERTLGSLVTRAKPIKNNRSTGDTGKAHQEDPTHGIPATSTTIAHGYTHDGQRYQPQRRLPTHRPRLRKRNKNQRQHEEDKRTRTCPHQCQTVHPLDRLLRHSAVPTPRAKLAILQESRRYHSPAMRISQMEKNGEGEEKKTEKERKKKGEGEEKKTVKERKKKRGKRGKKKKEKERKKNGEGEEKKTGKERRKKKRRRREKKKRRRREKKKRRRREKKTEKKGEKKTEKKCTGCASSCG